MGLLFISVLVMSLGFLFLAGPLLKTKIELSSHCVHRVLKLQSQLAKPLENLLKLNPKASKLRHRRTKAESQLLAAIATGNAPLIAKAKAEILIVTQLQLLLAARQKTHLALAQTLRIQFATNLGSLSLDQRQTQFPNESSNLAVTPIPKMSITPDYHPVDNFSQIQAQTYQVQVEKNGIKINHLCSATLKREFNKWIATLKPAKANWRSCYGCL